MKKTPILSLAFAALLLTGCGKFSDKAKTETPTTGSTVLACDRSFEKVMEQEISVFEYIYPDASILPLYMSEAQCIDSLVNGSARLAVTTRELNADERRVLDGKKRLISSQCIAVDAIAMITNKQNPVKDLTVAELQMIMSGEVTDWSQLDPSNKSGKINVVFDENGSSTITCVTQKVMDGKKYGPNVFAQGSNDKVFEYVAGTKGAIGIIGVSWISEDMKNVNLSDEFVKSLETDNPDEAGTQEFNDNINVLAVSGNTSLKAYRPFQKYIYDGSYPLVRKIYLISTGRSGSLASGFYAYVTSFSGQKLLRSTGVLPAGVHPRIMEVQ